MTLLANKGAGRTGQPPDTSDRCPVPVPLPGHLSLASDAQQAGGIWWVWWRFGSLVTGASDDVRAAVTADDGESVGLQHMRRDVNRSAAR